MSDDVIEPMSRASIGRYQLLKKLAAGGMAEIYLARVTGVGGFAKNVVLKRILPQLAESEQFFRMFLDEARIAATLQHPNVVQVYDAGEVDGQYYIAMEYLDGADLATVRRHLAERDEPMPLEHIVYIAGGVCAGLHYAHEKKDLDGRPLGIVHRDVSPQNVFITRDGGVKLVDFGIAKASNRLSRTTYGTMKGKIAYMAPEQCEGKRVDRRIDIYALGIVLYEAVTGKNPHRSTQAEYAMMKAIVEGTIDPPSTIDPTIAPGFEQVIMKAVAKNPDERYQTAREMQLDLESCARSEKLAISALRLSDYITPVLDSIREDNEARSERFADEVDAFEDYLHAKAAEGKRRHRNDPVSATADTAPALPASNPPDGADLQRAPRPADRPAVAARLDHITPPIELDGVNVRTGRGVALVIGVLAAAAAGLLIYWVMNRSPGEAPPVAETPEPAPEPAPIPEVGVVAASSTPEGAAVWRKLGRTPIEGLPVIRGKPLELRVVHEGYQGVALEAAASTGDDIAPVKLVPLDTIARAKPISWRAGKGASAYQPGDARLTITSEPPAAAVWVYAGTTPGVELAELPTDQPHELRFERPGYQPAFLEITERAWTVNGRAEVHPSLSK